MKDISSNLRRNTFPKLNLKLPLGMRVGVMIHSDRENYA